MDKAQFTKSLQELKKTHGGKRGFNQTIDLILNLKNLDMKKPDHNVDLFVALHFDKGKKVRVGALVGPELQEAAKEVCDGVLTPPDFAKYKEKRAIKKLADQYDFFVAQANIMPQIATAFGRVFGPRGKMPNPKAGCVVPPNANMKAVYEKLQKTLRVATKNAPCVKTAVGSEQMDEAQVVDNLTTTYNAIVHALPNEEQNVKNVLLKLTMSAPVEVGKK